uniref:Doublecortin domain-containing protein n=1 Tax=Loa loa TaxID=7209 RepID=A0A1I7V889_LOALO
MITERIKQECGTKKVMKGENNPLRYTSYKPKSATTFREVIQTLRSPGYLLPYDVHEKRRLMQSRRGTTSFSPSKQRLAKYTPKKNIQEETVHRCITDINGDYDDYVDDNGDDDDDDGDNNDMDGTDNNNNNDDNDGNDGSDGYCITNKIGDF